MILNEDQIVEELRRAGLKVTPQRLAVARALSGDETHPTAQGLYERLLRDHPTMSFATVYNTLAALARIGRVRALTFGAATRFDPNVEAHHHAICDRCGAVRDVPAGRSRERPPGEMVAGFEVHRVERIYRGLCAACRGGDAVGDESLPGSPRTRREHG